MNLQEAFQKFKKDARPKNNNNNKKRTQEFKDNWRLKFVEQCKKYIGVPYSRKDYWKTDPLYNSPLFLDCCGLVRRAIRDLKKDFGFKIGPGNQVYQFDTLPNTINQKDAKVGDLVFLKSVYIGKKNKRKQFHDLTHVEVYLGDGKTIGARFAKNFVKIWDNYKFLSKNYIERRYIFKSIDTWLDGVCKSFCKDHQWKIKNQIKIENLSKYSWFYEENNLLNFEKNIELNKIMSKNKKIFYTQFFQKNKINLKVNKFDSNLINENYYIIDEGIITNDINLNLKWYDLYDKFSKKIQSIELINEIKNNETLYIAKNLDDGKIKKLTTKNLKGNFLYQKYYKNFKLYNDYKITKKIFLFIHYGLLIGKKVVYLHSKNKKIIEDDKIINEFCRKFYLSGTIYDNLVKKKKKKFKNEKMIENITEELFEIFKNIPIIIISLDFFEVKQNDDILFDLDIIFSDYNKEMLKLYGNFFKSNFKKLN